MSGRSRIAVPAVAALLLALVLLSACSSGGTSASSSSPSSQVVVTVDGTPASAADLARVRAVSKLTGTELTRPQALKRLVSELLIARETRRLGVNVSAAEVTDRVAQLAKSAGGEKQLRSGLKSAGVTEAQLRAGIRAILLGEKLQDAKFPGLRATTAAARRFYDTNRDLFTTAASVNLGEIVMRTRPIAVSVRDRIAAGQSFESAAGQFSFDPELRAERGRLGWVTMSSLPAGLRKAVAGLKRGQVSDAVKVPPYWNLVKLYARRPASVTPFAKVAAPLRAELTRRKRDAALTSWVKEARATAKVTTQ
jgi:parvulin-like peptidyl-prolyl isomerase